MSFSLLLKISFFLSFLLWLRFILFRKREARAVTYCANIVAVVAVSYACSALFFLFFVLSKNIGPPPKIYLFSLFLTVLLECAVAVAMGYRRAREIASVALCSFVTHPTLHLAALLPGMLSGELYEGFSGSWALSFECVVLMVECALLDALLPLWRAKNAKLALAMNAFSYLTGLLLSAGVFWYVGG